MRAEVLIQVIVCDEQVITVIASIGSNHSIRRRDLSLDLQAEFNVASTRKIARSRGVVRRREGNPLRKELRCDLVVVGPLREATQHGCRGPLCHGKGASRVLCDSATRYERSVSVREGQERLLR